MGNGLVVCQLCWVQALKFGFDFPIYKTSMVRCPCHSGKGGTKGGGNDAITILSDSMIPTAMDVDGTQLPCSPAQLMNTDPALNTLKNVDDHDSAMQEEVH